MKQTIFNVCVPMENQAQCDRMKQLCLDAKLNSFYNSNTMWSLNDLFLFFGCYRGYFGIWATIKNLSQVTEAEFIELLKEYKNGKNTMQS